MTAKSFEEWHPHGFDDWWAREMEYQGFTSAHDGARRAWHECLRLFAAESASRAALLSPDVAGLVDAIKLLSKVYEDGSRPLMAELDPDKVINALESLVAQVAERDAEIARLKMENSKLRSALEIVHFKREPWQ